jgi:hypothetical protein
MSDSTFTRSMMIHFKGDTIHKLIFVYYLDWGYSPVGHINKPPRHTPQISVYLMKYEALNLFRNKWSKKRASSFLWC